MLDRIRQHLALPGHNGYHKERDPARVDARFRSAWHQNEVLVDLPDHHVGEHTVLHIDSYGVRSILFPAREDLAPNHAREVL